MLISNEMWINLIQKLNEMFTYTVAGIPILYIAIVAVLALVIYLMIKQFIKVAIIVTIVAVLVLYVIPRLPL